MSTPLGGEDGAATIIFVCTGNRARSALAAALLRRRAGEHAMLVESRGTATVDAAPVLPEMLRAGAGLELDLSDHRSVPLVPGECVGADLVLGFEQYHVAAAVVDGGAARDRTFTLPELVELAAGGTPRGAFDLRERIARVAADAHERRATGAAPPEIPDPLGASSEAFTNTALQIDRLIDDLASLVLDPVDSPTVR